MSKIDTQKTLPIIHNSAIIAKSQFFKIESIDLEFSNGATRTFERMAGSGSGAVMIVPMLNADTLLMIREYSAGTHNYQLGFPKGLIDAGETPMLAANRELKEEAGYGANHIHHLHSVHMAPTFFNAQMHIMVAQDLYPQSLVGDEPEPLEVIEWPLHQFDELLARPDFVEARCIAALFLIHKWLRDAKK